MTQRNSRGMDLASRPLVVVWELTQACDLACKHCRAEATPDRHPAELSTREGKELLDDIRSFGENQLVVLSGGDPLARDDVSELVEYGVDQGLAMTLTPSGTTRLTNDRVQQFADSGLRRLALSIDGGSQEAHDEFRQEPGSYEQTISAANAAVDAGLPLQINTTVCAETVDELPAIRDLLVELGAVFWSVFFLVPVGRGRDIAPISPNRAESVMEWLVEVQQSASFGLKTTEAPQFRRVAIQQTTADNEQQKGEGVSNQGITAGNGFVFVSHRGDVYPSGFLPVSAGNIRETSLTTLYRDEWPFTVLRNPNALEGKCGACAYRFVCGGSRSRAFAYTGDLLASDPLCSYVPEHYDGQLPRKEFA